MNSRSSVDRTPAMCSGGHGFFVPRSCHVEYVEGRPGTGQWEEKEYFNNIVLEIMIEDTPGYREMMRMTHDEFLEILGSLSNDDDDAEDDAY